MKIGCFNRALGYGWTRYSTKKILTVFSVAYFIFIVYYLSTFRERPMKSSEKSLKMSRSPEILMNIPENVLKSEEMLMNTHEMLIKCQEMLIKSQEMLRKCQEMIVKSPESLLNIEGMLMKIHEMMIKSPDILKSPEMLIENQEILMRNQEILMRRQETSKQSSESLLKNSDRLTTSPESLTSSPERLTSSPEIPTKGTETLSLKNKEDIALPSKPRHILGEELSFRIIEVDDDNLTYYDMNKIQDRIVVREEQTEQFCFENNDTVSVPSSEKDSYERIEIDIELGLLYCPLLKVGSTFWSRVFYALQTNLTIFTPYDEAIFRDKSTKRKKFISLPPINSPFTREYLKDSLKIMFVRNPYSRLLSGYVDKLFAPNPYFWQHVGRHIIKHYRQNPSENSLRCGHDVTFPEFVKYIVDTKKVNNQLRDAYFTPTYDQCKPCQIQYNTIGHLETFNEDTAFILTALGYNISINSLNLWAYKFEEDAIRDAASSPFSWRKKIVQCMPFEEAVRRIWRKMQLRGIIKEHANYEQVIENMTIQKFISAMMENRWSDSEKNMKKHQKLKALQAAYSIISPADVDKIRTLFLKDFKMFGYDAHSKNIFPDKRVKNAWVFSI